MIDLQETSNGLMVKVNNAQVSQVVLTVQLGITVRDEDGDYLGIVISTALRWRKSQMPEEIFVDPENDDSNLGSLILALRYQRLTTCAIAGNGTLRLEFASGLTITVPPDPTFEAWDLDHRQFKVIGTPNGELAIWDRPQRSKDAPG
jgi:hypothetical protein